MIQLVLELLRQRRRLLTTIAVLMVLNCALAALVSLYQAPRLQTAYSAWNDLRRRAAQGRPADVATLYRQAAGDLEAVRTRIPLKKEFPRVLGDIIDAASTSGVAIAGLSYKPQAVKNEKLLQYQLSLSVSGSYAATKSFLADLQGNRELLIVDGISLNNNDPFEEHVTTDLELSLYLQESP